MSDRYDADSRGHITGYNARCPWCGAAPMFIHLGDRDSVICDACDSSWQPADEETLFVIHAASLAVPIKENPMADTDFEFQLDSDGTPLTMDGAVFQALGAASTCWETLEGTGVFQSDRAKAIGEALVDFIKAETDQPRLGYATTRQLLDELRARIDVDYHAGGGGLEYSTMGGRPESIVAAP